MFENEQKILAAVKLINEEFWELEEGEATNGWYPLLSFMPYPHGGCAVFIDHISIYDSENDEREWNEEDTMQIPPIEEYIRNEIAELGKRYSIIGARESQLKDLTIDELDKQGIVCDTDPDEIKITAKNLQGKTLIEKGTAVGEIVASEIVDKKVIVTCRMYNVAEMYENNGPVK